MANNKLANNVIILTLASMFLTVNSYAMGKKPEQPKESSAPAVSASQEVEIITPEKPSNPGAEVAKPSPAVTAETFPQEQTAVTAEAPEGTSRIKDIQLALKNAGFDPGSVDGKMGRKTKRAVREFQSSNSLKVDGKVGPKTWAALQKYLTTTTSSTGTTQ